MFEIKLIFYGLSCMLQFSEFVWALSYSVWDVFNYFLLIDASDRSKISSDQKSFFIAFSLYPLSFFANTPFKVTSCPGWKKRIKIFKWNFIAMTSYRDERGHYESLIIKKLLYSSKFRKFYFIKSFSYHFCLQNINSIIFFANFFPKISQSGWFFLHN